MGMKSIWTPKEDEMLRRLWARKPSLRVHAIAAEIGKTSTQVNGRRFALGLPPRHFKDRVQAPDTEPKKQPWTRAETDTLYREWAKGTAVSLIAAMVGKTYKQVLVKREYQKLPPRRKGRPDDALVRISVYIPGDVGIKATEVASMLGLSRSAYVAKLVLREIRA